MVDKTARNYYTVTVYLNDLPLDVEGLYLPSEGPRDPEGLVEETISLDGHEISSLLDHEVYETILDEAIKAMREKYHTKGGPDNDL